jgi:hypothetical protein
LQYTRHLCSELDAYMQCRCVFVAAQRAAPRRAARRAVQRRAVGGRCLPAALPATLPAAPSYPPCCNVADQLVCWKKAVQSNIDALDGLHPAYNDPQSTAASRSPTPPGARAGQEGEYCGLCKGFPLQYTRHLCSSHAERSGAGRVSMALTHWCAFRNRGKARRKDQRAICVSASAIRSVRAQRCFPTPPVCEMHSNARVASAVVGVR